MAVREDDIRQEYPLQQHLESIPYLNSVPYLTPFRAGVCLVLLIFLFELIRVSFQGPTKIPFKYPLYLDVVLFAWVLYLLENLHESLDKAKAEIMQLADVSADRPNIPDDEIPERERIRNTFEHRVEFAFDPKVLFMSSFGLGLLTLLIMASLGVLDSYPYLVMNFIFGATHGLLLPYLLILTPLLRIVPRDFMNDLNALDTSGVGGYPAVGETIAKASFYGAILFNLDFLILGSVAFLDNITFQLIVLIIYVVELLLLFGYSLGATLRIRNTLKEIRDQRVYELKYKYGLDEGTFLTDNEDEGQEVEDMLRIITYTMVFRQLDELDLWPINMVWWTRFLGGVFASTLVIIIQLILVIDVDALVTAFT